jgi:hypothetical protein
MDDAARTVAKCMEDQPGEMTRQEIIDEVAFTLLDEVAEYFDTYHGNWSISAAWSRNQPHSFAQPGSFVISRPPRRR